MMFRAVAFMMGVSGVLAETINCIEFESCSSTSVNYERDKDMKCENTNEDCIINCIGERSCMGLDFRSSDLRRENGHKFLVHCKGKNSCIDSRPDPPRRQRFKCSMPGSPTAGVAELGDCDLLCTGEGSCINMRLRGLVSHVQCDGLGACRDTYVNWEYGPVNPPFSRKPRVVHESVTCSGQAKCNRITPCSGLQECDWLNNNDKLTSPLLHQSLNNNDNYPFTAQAKLMPRDSASEKDCTMYTYQHEYQTGTQQDVVGPIIGEPAHAEAAVKGHISSIRLSGPPGCTGRFWCDTGCLTNTHFVGHLENPLQPYSFEWTIPANGSDVLKTLKTDLVVYKTTSNGGGETTLQDPLGAHIDITLPTRACSTAICPQDLCPDGLGRRPVWSAAVGDDCCGCPYHLVLQSFGGGTVSFTTTHIKPASRNAIVYDITSSSGSSQGITSVPAGSTFKVHCLGYSECDAFVFTYHDPPASSSTNGDLPVVLVDDGWSSSSCAPTFTLTKAGTEGCEYKMVAFRKVLGQGGSADITVGSRQLKFLIIMLVPKVSCDNSLTEEQCTATHAVSGKSSTCKYVGDLCKDNFCMRTPSTHTRGPTPPTSCPAANTDS